MITILLTHNDTSVTNDDSTNAYQPFKIRDYHEGSKRDKNFLCVTNLKQPFIQAECFSLVNNIPSSIYPRHIQEFYTRYYFDIPTLTLQFHVYGHDYAWDLRKLGRVLNVSSKGTLFYTKSTDTKAFMKLKNYHPSSFACDPPVNSITIQNTLIRPEFHCEGIPSKSWEKHQLHPHLNAWADVLLTNMFAKIKAQESLPSVVGHMLYCIKTKTPFNFAYFIARRLSGLAYNNEALPYDRVMTTLFEYLKNKHSNDASQMIKVEEVSPM
ncbi:hypothetical protein Tco_1054686 [Tanacetum coccineum]|uniref:Uncharacterized protein n=1 Tax=Tanacetum coccineum TaxID=301880 RepID=A0ABQ5GYE7_9ASTR